MFEVASISENISSNLFVSTAPPIFILGVMPRSGTHYLSNLVCLHPECQKAAIDEDFLLFYADHLTRFANGLENKWETLGLVNDSSTKEMLLECLGEGLVSFLHNTRKQAFEKRAREFNIDIPQVSFNKRIVTKTPFIDNLHKFFSFFPNSHLLILVRDGRAVVESGTRSSQEDSEAITRDWALSVDRILRFDRDPQNAKYKYLIVRYEDLFSDTERSLRTVLEFLQLEQDTYDFQAAADAPVVGSSTYKRDTDNLNWNKEKKTEDFKPLDRAAGWTRAQHERFNWLAAKQLKAFGYEPKTFSNSNLFWTIWNKVLDFKWTCKIWLRRFKKGFLFVTRRLKANLYKPAT